MSETDGLQMPTPLIHTQLNAQATMSTATLKRRASSSFDGCEGDTSRKRIKEDKESATTGIDGTDVAPPSVSPTLADDLARDLECGCCAELVYKPVLNGGTNCPACRSLSTGVTPFRALQSVIDTLLRAAPHKARTERECQQADEIYRFGQSIRIPSPREPSPEPNVDAPAEFARPCPHCIAGNPFGWRCPQPIPDPNVDMEHAWHFDDGVPPGHAHCGNCSLSENLLATRAPQTTTKCDLCQVYFCGINVQNRCVALPLLAQQPHGLSDLGDLILSSDIVADIQAQPTGFKPLIEQDVFADMHGVVPGVDSDPDAPRNNICRHCAYEVFLWGLNSWWVRERQKGFLEEAVMSRKDCPQGQTCERQSEHGEPLEPTAEPTAPSEPVTVEPQLPTLELPEMEIQPPAPTNTATGSNPDPLEPPEPLQDVFLWDVLHSVPPQAGTPILPEHA
ncbi:hypothetical protein H0H92_006031 [Tricholoma furcatifolium]|nr:hypothetical protein H0H92_006031 [Tricholoma furcatifolium]